MLRKTIGTGLFVARLALAAGLAVSFCAGTAVWAQTVAGQGAVKADRATVDGLIATMHIDAVIAILRDEGLDYGASIADEMFPDAPRAAWQATVARTYDAGRMKSAFADTLLRELQGQGADVAPMQDFFAAPLGQKVLRLELEARKALLDDETEAAAGIAWSDLDAAGGPRAELIRRFAVVNDLVESNVMGALNANLAFYKGMAATGGMGEDMTEDQMLQDVWAQEPDIRRQTEEWVYPYLSLAYSSLSDDELRQYVEFSASPAGQALNAALFTAFDAVFTPISAALGSAASLQLLGQDI